MSADAAPSFAASPVPCTPADAAAFVAAAARRAGTGIVHVTVPAPLAPLESLLALGPGQPAALWAPPRGAAFSGVGAAARIDVAGPDRLDELRRRARGLWRRLRVDSLPGIVDAEELLPRLVGGLAFAPGSATEPAWSAFGDGSFVLPRLRYLHLGDRAFLTAAADGTDARLASEVAHVLRRLGAASRPPGPQAGLRHLSELPLAPWTALVDDIRAAIRAGDFDKIVAARRSLVELDAPIEPAAVLARLAAEYPDCFRFGFRRGEASFVGATPERLVSKRGRAIETEALAGSIDVSDENGGNSVAARGAELRASAKDLAEHRFVVRAIEDELAPLCEQLDVPSRPTICALRHVLHLRTPLRGMLARDGHVLDLVAALHPTPAVGGVPTAAAVRWIAEREPTPRGWYAGPVGWFDAAGDGEFAVALRAGLLTGDRAYVYAGAGIVADSDAAAEYAETDTKQRALLGALGVLE